MTPPNLKWQLRKTNGMWITSPTWMRPKSCLVQLNTCKASAPKVSKPHSGQHRKNAPLILERLGISALFDVIVDGNKVTQAKPDPEVFLRAAHELSIPPASCVVFEDAEAGVEAARRAGMGTVGIGDPSTLKRADIVIPGLFELAVISAC